MIRPSQRIGIFFTGLLLLTLSFGCSSDKGAHPEVPLKVKSYSFYKDFIAIDTLHIAKSLGSLEQKYPDFLNFYLDTVLSLNFHGHYSDANPVLHSLLTYKDYRHLFDTVKMVFPDVEKPNQEIIAAFKNLKYYDSVFRIPTRIYYYISYLHLSAFTHNDTILGIGLDMFLGRDFPPYQSVGIPKYATIRFTKENIPVWACRVVYENRFPFNPEGKNLLQLMIEKGKEMYFLKKCLPDVPERLFFGFTKAQMNWCRQHEAMIYNLFIQNKLLYQTRLQDIMRYVLDGSTTTGFPPEAPGNLGTYVGYKIVSDYAHKEDATLEMLLTQKNAQKILNKANYKP